MIRVPIIEILKKAFGVILIIIGLVSIFTPLTPFGLLFFAGIEILGWRLSFGKKLRNFQLRN